MGAVSIAGLLEYDLWATSQALGPTAMLSNEQFVREFSGDLSSVRQQSVHLVSVSNRYRARIMGEPVPDVQSDSFSCPADVAAYAQDVAERMREMAALLTADRLAEEIRHETKRGVFVQTVEQTLFHVVNHGTYHRGQIACLLKLHGVEPVDTDMVIWWKIQSG